MSASMLLGRVILPASAVLLAIALGWQWFQGAAARSGSATTLTTAVSTGGAPAQSDNLSGSVRSEGRIVAYPGAEVTVGTEVLGTIVAMPVRENSPVRKGALLAELRADEVRASLREAHARLTEAEVGLRLEQARSGLDRILPRLAPSHRRRHSRSGTASRRRPPVATPPAPTSIGSKPRRPSTASSPRSTASSSRGMSTRARRSARRLPW